jgi:hypothetical protein
MLEPAATSPAAGSSDALAGRAAAAWLRRNVHAVIFAAIYAGALFALASQEFVQDTWLTLSGGRDVVRHGLPWHERLTVLNRGHEWVDQQWLGKVFLYTVAHAGGLRLLLIAHVVFVAGAIALAFAVARRRGASDAAVFWVGLATLPVAPWAWQLRVQSLAYVLFVGVVALLSSNRGAITRRSWLVVPLLVLWANVHGSVTLGAALAVAAGLLRLRRQPVAGSVLAIVSGVTLVASPYGLHLVHYYRTLLFNPTLARYVGEWRPSSYPAAVPFFLLLLGVTWLVARNGRALSAFEYATLAVTAAAGLAAIRGIVWFALAVIVVLPKVLDAERRGASASSVRILQPLAAVCCAAALFVGVAAVARLPGAVAATYPPGAADAVARAAAQDPSATVFASERYANWLLWRDPKLSGRLVYDVRFELFSPKQFEDLALFHDRVGTTWTRIADGARLLVLDLAADRRAANALRARPGTSVLFEGDGVAVLAR